MPPPPTVPLEKALRILTRIMESPYGKPADRGAAATALVHIERLESERDQVTALLPEDTEGLRLTVRVAALVGLAESRREALERAHARIRDLRGGVAR